MLVLFNNFCVLIVKDTSVILIVLIFKSIYVITKEIDPCNNLYLIIWNILIFVLYMHEYIWNIIDNPLNPKMNEIIDIVIV